MQLGKVKHLRPELGVFTTLTFRCMRYFPHLAGALIFARRIEVLNGGGVHFSLLDAGLITVTSKRW